MVNNIQVDEMKNLERYREMMNQENLKSLSFYKENIVEFKKYCSGFGITIDDDSFDFIPAIGVVARYPNILIILESRIVIDKESLIDCNLLDEIYTLKVTNPGYFYCENYMAMANPVFRRGMHGINNWSPNFIKAFWEFEKKNIDSYLSLDLDRVRVNVDDYCALEADTWYGAHYNRDITKIDDGPTYLRPPQDIDKILISFYFGSTYALDIFWSTKGNIKTFQALEFKEENITIELDGQVYHPARYIHAEYDLDKGIFRHLDGAVQYYLEDEYIQRRDSNFRHNLKSSVELKARSRKFFKFNGSISTDVWSDFCTQYLTGNPLIYEYFTGSYPQSLVLNLERLRHRNS